MPMGVNHERTYFVVSTHMIENLVVIISVGLATCTLAQYLLKVIELAHQIASARVM